MHYGIKPARQSAIGKKLCTDGNVRQQRGGIAHAHGLVLSICQMIDFLQMFAVKPSNGIFERAFDAQFH